MTGMPARILAWLLLVSMGFQAKAQLRVTQSGGSDPETQDGSSWEQAFSAAKLAELLSFNSRGASSAEFWLAAGIYSQLRPHRGTQIYGGFDGTEDSRDARDPSRNHTFIQGIYLGEYRVLDQDGELTDIQYPGAGTVIDGCVIAGTVSLSFPADAMLDGPPLISNCRISGSTGGAAVSITAGPLRLIDCEIGAAGAVGVVVGHPNGSVDLQRCSVTGHLEAGILIRGGASATVTRCTITDNGRAALNRTPIFRFSGIYIDNASAEIRESEISGNMGGHGGGIAITLPSSSAHRVLVADSSITGNSSPIDLAGGGGIWVSTYQPGTQDQVVITNCVISGNSSTWRGGGVYLSGSGARVHNSTIRENQTAGSGGGIYIFGNPSELTSTFPIVRNSLIVENAAVDGGVCFSKIPTHEFSIPPSPITPLRDKAAVFTAIKIAASLASPRNSKNRS